MCAAEEEVEHVPRFTILENAMIADGRSIAATPISPFGGGVLIVVYSALVVEDTLNCNTRTLVGH